VFAGLPNPFVGRRYHSLAVSEVTLPEVLAISAYTSDGEIMGVRHRSLPIEGVQFHPESVLTPLGDRLIANFLGLRVRGLAEELVGASS
jgi:anthranilate/para-aminobenzoate synthase component II